MRHWLLRARYRRRVLPVAALVLGVAAYGWYSLRPQNSKNISVSSRPSAADTKAGQAANGDAGAPSLTATQGQLQQIKVAAIAAVSFRSEKAAIGQIAFNEDLTTPIFSPFTGRVTKLLAKLGDDVTPGMALFEIDTPDVVQAQSDLINATVAMAKSRTQISQLEKAYRRQSDLYKAKAVSQKDFEQAQTDLRQAESDLKANEGLLIASRNKLRILGRNDAEVALVEVERQINPIMVVRSPIAGTITTRKVGPGQYVRTDNTDPLFSISDLSNMWVRANVSEVDIPFISAGQQVEVRVMAYPNELFKAKVTYIAAAVDPTTHRVAVRSEIANPKRLLKPEMFASFKIVTGQSVPSPALPAGAVIREADAAYIWIASTPSQFVRRPVKIGLEQNGLFQIVSGAQAGENAVIEGAVFLSNAKASGLD